MSETLKINKENLGLKKILLNEYLNAKNIWTGRLLGLKHFKVHRDAGKIESEYNQDKYGSLLKFNLKNCEQAGRKEFEISGIKQGDSLVISLKDELFQMNLSLARKLFYLILKEKIESYKSDFFCELGCGYGFNLSLLDGETYGGECSENAIGIARKLGQNVMAFNFYNLEDYQMIRRRSTVFTVYALEQIPDSNTFIDGMASQKDRIEYVVHFEPTIIETRTNLIGLCRNKYIEMNDYNRNLKQLLTSRSDIEVLEYEQDVIGLNPLHPANLIVWRFK